MIAEYGNPCNKIWVEPHTFLYWNFQDEDGMKFKPWHYELELCHNTTLTQCSRANNSGMSYSLDFHRYRLLEIMSSAPTNAGKHVMSNIACAHCQRFTKDSVFWLAVVRCQDTYIPPFVEPKVISDGPANRLLIHKPWSDGPTNRLLIH